MPEAMIEVIPEAAEITFAEAYRRDGYTGPIPLFTADQCALITRHFNHCRDREKAEWSKGWAAADPLYFEAATRPALLKHLTAILGPDIILWGCSILPREPGQVHPWHVDIESAVPEGGYASVWIGLENTTRESSLRVIPGSQRIGATIQELRHRREVDRRKLNDETVLAWARECVSDATIVDTDLSDGDGIIFDGRLWHATNNRRSEGRRLAILLQYASADRAIYRPAPGQVDWPFDFDQENRPPVIAVQGQADGNRNRIIEAPRHAHPKFDPLRTEHHHLSVPLPSKGDNPWTPHRLFSGPSPNHGFLGVHASTLQSGHSPHPPHIHVGEELLIVLGGRGDLLLGDGPDPDKAKRVPVEAGSFSYYPAYQYHSILNSGSAPLTYLMFKWAGAPHEVEGALTTQVIHTAELSPKPRPDKALHVKHLLNDPRGYLGRLNAHLSEMEPGGSYPAHADAYDVAIIVLSGSLEANAEVVGPNTVLYYAEGAAHGLKNIGPDRARYLVFEFERPSGRTYLTGQAKGRRKRNRKASGRTPFLKKLRTSISKRLKRLMPV
jgi:quercetin dioxygenase-like cupin family protein